MLLFKFLNLLQFVTILYCILPMRIILLYTVFLLFIICFFIFPVYLCTYIYLSMLLLLIEFNVALISLCLLLLNADRLLSFQIINFIIPLQLLLELYRIRLLNIITFFSSKWLMNIILENSPEKYYVVYVSNTGISITVHTYLQ